MTVAAWLLAACSGGGNNSNSDPTPAAADYVNWTNSANGTVVKDWANHDFRVRASDRVVVDANNTVYAGAVVDASAQLSLNSKIIGKVSLAKSSSGTQIAVFACTDGSGLVWGNSNGSYSYNCMSSDSGSSSGGAGSTSQPSPGTTYISWSGSANGVTVVDANNAQFEVRASDGTVVFGNSTVLNGAVVNGSSLSIGGNAAGNVTLVDGSGGSKIAAFTCPSGDLLAFSLSGSTYSWKCPSAASTSSGSGSGGNTSSGSSTSSGGSSAGNTGSVNFTVLSNACGVYGGGPYNSCITQIQNTGTVPMSCVVNYYYSYVDSTSALQADQEAESTGRVVVGSTGSTQFGLADRNISLTSYRVSCSAWPFN
ncbi:hypothetical protein [Paraburkholderia sp. J76]|uniref:hypothetical protein n=1 Tax=Paraburkholderia sp. J76 TaxID=2805439 RepID=UPI002ABDAE6E|nr:hypothetical protein [Paraburkholderia sp. J76]